MTTLPSRGDVERQVSTFGLGSMADHPLIKNLPTAKRDIILKNAKGADTNGDGELSLDEFISCQLKTLEDVEANAKKQARLEHTVKWGGAGVILGWLGNFGLIWAVVALTQKVGLNNGSMVDSKTGQTLSTRVGSHLTAARDPDLIERRLAIQESGNNEDDVRKLVESIPLGTVFLSKDEAAALRERILDGHSVTVALNREGTAFYWVVNSIASFTPGGTNVDQPCDFYSRTQVTSGAQSMIINVECCSGNDHCSYYENYETSRRLVDAVPSYLPKASP